MFEALAQYFALGSHLFALSSRQLLLGMVFVFAILVPRFLKLTGSAATTLILGGLTYTLLHVWDAWTVFDSPGAAALSIIFLLSPTSGPGWSRPR